MQATTNEDRARAGAYRDSAVTLLGLALRIARDAIKADPWQADNVGTALAETIAEALDLELCDRELVGLALSEGCEKIGEEMR